MGHQNGCVLKICDGGTRENVEDCKLVKLVGLAGVLCTCTLMSMYS